MKPLRIWDQLYPEHKGHVLVPVPTMDATIKAICTTCDVELRITHEQFLSAPKLEEEPTMSRTYEYKVQWTNLFEGEYFDKLEQLLEKWDGKGWELVSTSVAKSSERTSTVSLFLFLRRKL